MEFEVRRLGRRSYREAWDDQLEVLAEVQAGGPNQLLLVEHDPVLTLGAGFHAENLLFTESEYNARGIDVVITDRGGDVTYHGPGQLVIYPIFDLSGRRDLHAWLRSLEEAIIVALRAFGLESRRFPPNTGVWIGDRKIAAIGIKIRRWVNLHGIALNCNVDLTPYASFIPCGIRDYGVTSLTQELGRTVTSEEAEGPVIDAFRSVFAND